MKKKWKYEQIIKRQKEIYFIAHTVDSEYKNTTLGISTLAICIAIRCVWFSSQINQLKNHSKVKFAAACLMTSRMQVKLHMIVG
jgi:hypothetical protein